MAQNSFISSSESLRRLALRAAGFAASCLISWPILFALASLSNPATIALFADERHHGSITHRSLEWEAQPLMRDSLDVLFVGSSVCYGGIDPQHLEAYGLTGFNFCSSSQAFEVSVALAAQAAAESQAHTIVLDLYMWGYAPLESTRDWVTNTSLWSGGWKQVWQGLSDQTRDPYTLALARIYPILRKFKAAGTGVPPAGKTAYRGRGFAARTFAPLNTPPLCDDGHLPAETDFATTVCEVYAALEARLPGHTILLLTPPELCPPAHARPDCIPAAAWIVGQQWPGASDFRHYFDDHHLVESGAAEYSPWLAREIAQRLE